MNPTMPHLFFQQNSAQAVTAQIRSGKVFSRFWKEKLASSFICFGLLMVWVKSW